MKHAYLKSVLTTALGFGALTASSLASAGVLTANWTGYFIMLDYAGNPLRNTSLPTKANQYLTPISGTMSFDDVTGAGTASLTAFNFFSNYPTLPAIATGIEMQAIGDGMGGQGTLVLGNMLFNWNGNNGIPVSLVLDAAGFFAGEYAPGGATSAVPATDGTYTDALYGYLAQGPMPMVTTAWNTSFAPNCTGGNCMTVSPSGILPLVVDTAFNESYDIVANTGGAGTWSDEINEYHNGIGGNPMADGPFQGSNANFQVATFSNFSYDANGFIAPHCDWGVACPPPVPVPAAAWLFGSGLLGLIGVARRSRA